MKYNNIFIVGSPWHAILTLAILQDHDAVIIEYSSKSTLSAVKKCLCGNVKILAEIEAKKFYLSTYFSLNDFMKIFFLRNEIEKLKIYQQELSCKNLNVFAPSSEVSKILADSIDFDVLNKIEDGICDYMPFALLPSHSCLKKLLRKVLISFLKLPYFYSNDFKLNFKSHYYFFPHLISSRNTSFSLLDQKEELINTLLKMGSDINVLPNYTFNKDCLLIGQTLFEDRSCSLDYELEIYREVSKSFLKSKNSNVYFKPHPRSCSAKMERLKKYALENPKFILLEGDFAVEILMVKYKFKSIVGFWSNPIILARTLFDCESYTMIHQLLSSHSLPHLEKIHTVLSELFPSDYIDYRVNQ